ncbi:MAG: ADP-ribosylglycohydrolase family protein, partial [Alicyclobacillus sp.]|nr:ADP-ribosylglycohydrolase family protein [Alicyclobacillus sp.]
MAREEAWADRLRGGVWGLLLGDAVGVPYEGCSPQLLPPASQLDLMPPPGFSVRYRQVPPGTWSDDGAQALCLLESLLTRGCLDLDDFAAKLVAWYERGLWTVDGRVFGVGHQTREAIRQLRRGVPPARAGQVLPEGKGNGALMRTLPLALWHKGTDADLVAAAHQQALVTHGHVTNQVCCALYCLW